MARSYWLMKSEPDVFGIDHLERAPGRTTAWDGVRNYQARNHMRAMRLGDGVLFYHSNADPLAVVGSMVVTKEAYADPTQFDPDSPYFDPKATPDQPRWSLVEVTLEQRFARPVLRETLAATPGLESMELLRRGSRLSVIPITESEWRIIHDLI